MLETTPDNRRIEPRSDADMAPMVEFIRSNAITEVECLVPDMSGIARGKILPTDKFLRILPNRGLRIPESVFVQTVTGEYPENETVTSATESDVYMVPDPRSIRFVPWAKEPTAQIICDVVYQDRTEVDFASRSLLKHVVGLFEQQGWKPLVAPELEFYLVDINTDPDIPLEPPIGRSGRKESGRQAYGIDAVNEFDPIFEDIYDFCEAQRIGIDTLSHESGAAQIEINFDHSSPLELADQTFMFKRTAREAALKHKIYATFMAKPMQNEPGSAMHVHQSLFDLDEEQNLFAGEDENDISPMLRHYIGGLQKFLPLAAPLYAPNVNSYRRLRMAESYPINVYWGFDNRTVGLRVPISTSRGRRVEVRVAGADANPYLAIAATLASGYLGIMNEIEPEQPIMGNAGGMPSQLPHHQMDALEYFSASEELAQVLGRRFTEAYVEVKRTEYDAYFKVISSWERENLLLNV